MKTGNKVLVRFFPTSVHVIVLQVDLRIGLYSVFLKDYYKVFPKQQVFVQRLEDRIRDMNKTMKEIFTFLEMGTLYFLFIFLFNNRPSSPHQV